MVHAYTHIYTTSAQLTRYQFGAQEPGTAAEIKSFTKNYGVTFPVLAKVRRPRANSRTLVHFSKLSPSVLILMYSDEVAMLIDLMGLSCCCCFRTVAIYIYIGRDVGVLSWTYHDINTTHYDVGKLSLIGFTGFDPNAPAFKMAFSTTIAPNPPLPSMGWMPPQISSLHLWLWPHVHVEAAVIESLVSTASGVWEYDLILYDIQTSSMSCELVSYVYL